MATPTSGWSSFGVGVPAAGTEGNREDLLDLITNLDKEKSAALFQALPKTTTNSLTHEWLIDALAATSTAGVTEGDDFSASARAARTRISNIVQSFRDDFLVTNDQLKLSQNGVTAGVPNEYEYQVGKSLITIMQSIDARLMALGASSAATAGGTATARRMNSLRVTSWGGVAAVTATAGATGAAISLTQILSVHETMFTAGANPDTIVVSPGVKMDLTNALLNVAPAGGSAQSSLVRYTQPSSQVYDQAVEYIRTDLGRFAILVDRFCPQSTASAAAAIDSAAYFIFDKSKIRLAFFRPIRHYPLPPNGDSMRGFVHGSCTVEVLHPSALATVAQVTT